LQIYISQGSVAIRYDTIAEFNVEQLRCGILSYHYSTNFRRNVPVKSFENWSIFDRDMDKSLWLTFLDHPVCWH